MVDENSAAWPQTPAGVTDWETVFEDPKTGFIALIRSAQSPEILKDCATVVVQKLFTRDGDAMHVMRYIIDLEGILPDGNGQSLGPDEIESMRDAVTAFLRKIKIDRIAFAEEYRRKRQKDGNRRSV